jgi:Enterochelin esterase and related enzymes
MPRVTGPLEEAWMAAGGDPHCSRLREDLLATALYAENPSITERGGLSPGSGPSTCLYTWTIVDSAATAVALWTNAVFDERSPECNELTRLPGSDLWTITLCLPREWRSSYRLAVWRDAVPPPWRVVKGRHASRRAAIASGGPDPRARLRIAFPSGSSVSLAAGPDAPADRWGVGLSCAEEQSSPAGGRPAGGSEGPPQRPGKPDEDPTRASGGAVHVECASRASPGGVSPRERVVPPRGGLERLSIDGTRAWVYRPPRLRDAPALPDDPRPARSPNDPASSATPLLVLFDGDMWARRLRLGDALDRAIASSLLPPLHVAMLDSLDVGTRWRTLGVPGGHVDVVLDGLLPRIRACYPVSAEGTGTIVAGQSLGGLSALWTLALGEGMVGHAIAQSPALWRFDVAEPLLAERRWIGADIQAGAYEAETLALSTGLVTTLKGAGRRARLAVTCGGHDWAWWRISLLDSLADILHPRGD